MKIRENTQNPQSSRGTSTLYKRLGVSNHFHTLFLISNENLTPTLCTFSEFLSANFRENRKQKSDFEFFHFFAKTRKIAYNRRPKSAENRRLLLIFTWNVHFQRSEIGGLSPFNSSVHHGIGPWGAVESRETCNFQSLKWGHFFLNVNWSTTFQPSKIGQFFKFWWGLRACERNASSN